MTKRVADKRAHSVGARIIEGLREFAEALENGEAIVGRFTYRGVTHDLVPRTYDRKTVKATRELLGTSQVVFAKLLGVRVKAVRAWEQGANTPSDLASRFMDEIRRNPNYWRKRLRESVKVKHTSP